MPNLSESQLGTVRALIQAAPDRAIRDLETALSGGADRHEAMRMIHRMVNAEAMDRRTRYAVFSPLMPLCVVRPPGAAGFYFPSSTPGLLWKALKEEAPAEVQQAADLVTDNDTSDPLGLTLNALCRKAVEGLRTRSNSYYVQAAELLDRSQPDGAETFAKCMDLAAIARSVLEQLPDWLARMTEDRVVAARLAFKDAVDVAEDAGPRLLEILYVQLDEPWLILRLISAVMHRPADRYVASSELGSFGDRLMDDIDARLKRISAFNAEGGSPAGVAAACDVNIAAQVVAEFDKTVELSPEGPWGARLTLQKRGLAQAVEGRLRAIESQVAAALPLQTSGFRKRGTRPPPRLSDDPNPRQVESARAFLSFMHEVRESGERLGFGSTWAKISESLEAHLLTYVEDLLDRLHAHEEGDDPERIRKFLDIAAEFLGLACGDKAAQIVRRRMAAA
jgi:hypothetical protein